MFNYDSIEFNYDPYPIGFTTELLPKALYQELTESFPRVDQLRRAESMGDGKYLLTEFDTEPYFRIIDSSPPWRRLYDYVKSREFIEQTLGALKKSGIDPGLSTLDIVNQSRYQPSIGKLRGAVERRLQRIAGKSGGHLTSRFEFSALQGKQASHRPHTDAPRKVISMVVSMMKPGEWQDDWGGGTAVCRPKDVSRSFNYLNAYMSFDDVEVLRTYPFVPNGCVLFVKTFNSWHTVMPFTVPPSATRKSIVINIDWPQALGASRGGY